MSGGARLAILISTNKNIIEIRKKYSVSRPLFNIKMEHMPKKVENHLTRLIFFTLLLGNLV